MESCCQQNPECVGRSRAPGCGCSLCPDFCPRGSVVTAGKGSSLGCLCGVPLCVSRHFPSYLCFSDMVLGHDMHPDPLFGCPLGQLAFWPGCTVIPSFSPVLLACPPGPPFTCPQVLMPVVCTLHVTPGKRVVRKGHTAPCSCQMPLQHCRADGLGLTEAVTHSWQVTWGWAVGWPRAQACHKFCGDLFPLEQRGLALSSWGERA